MTLTDAPAAPALHTYPVDEWVRSITFFDTPARPDDVPVHVTLGILINDQPASLRVPRDFEWSVVGSTVDATVVSFVVHEDDVEMGRIDPDGTHHPARIAGLQCLTPVNQSSLWQRLNTYRAAQVYPLRDDGSVSGYPDDADGTYCWVRVFLQVREVKIVASARH